MGTPGRAPESQIEEKMGTSAGVVVTRSDRRVPARHGRLGKNENTSGGGKGGTKESTLNLDQGWGASPGRRERGAEGGGSLRSFKKNPVRVKRPCGGSYAVGKERVKSSLVQSMKASKGFFLCLGLVFFLFWLGFFVFFFFERVVFFFVFFYVWAFLVFEEMFLSVVLDCWFFRGVMKVGLFLVFV